MQLYMRNMGSSINLLCLCGTAKAVCCEAIPSQQAPHLFTPAFPQAAKLQEDIRSMSPDRPIAGISGTSMHRPPSGSCLGCAHHKQQAITLLHFTLLLVYVPGDEENILILNSSCQAQCLQSTHCPYRCCWSCVLALMPAPPPPHPFHPQPPTPSTASRKAARGATRAGRPACSAPPARSWS